MPRRRKVPHQITLIAFSKDRDGSRVIADIVETSRHHAPFFMRGYLRNAEISHVAAVAPSFTFGIDVEAAIRAIR